ncbi:MAG: PadR family transcriptional regulator [Candidatus Omnitrophota bacterium]
MIEQELLLLGLLKERPRHGYEIKKSIKDMFSLFAGVDLKSVYYPLRLLEESGLVVKHANKEGRRPVRFIYKLTGKGEERFRQLLNKSLLELKRPQFNLDLSLYFLNYLKAPAARRRLCGRIFILNKVAKDLKRMIEGRKKEKLPVRLISILEHNLKMLDAESRFLAGMVRSQY